MVSLKAIGWAIVVLLILVGLTAIVTGFAWLAAQFPVLGAIMIIVLIIIILAYFIEEMFF